MKGGIKTNAIKILKVIYKYYKTGFAECFENDNEHSDLNMFHVEGYELQICLKYLKDRNCIDGYWLPGKINECSRFSTMHITPTGIDFIEDKDAN